MTTLMTLDEVERFVGQHPPARAGEQITIGAVVVSQARRIEELLGETINAGVQVNNYDQLQLVGVVDYALRSAHRSVAEAAVEINAEAAVGIKSAQQNVLPALMLSLRLDGRELQLMGKDGGMFCFVVPVGSQMVDISAHIGKKRITIEQLRPVLQRLQDDIGRLRTRVVILPERPSATLVDAEDVPYPPMTVAEVESFLEKNWMKSEVVIGASAPREATMFLTVLQPFRGSVKNLIHLRCLAFLDSSLREVAGFIDNHISCVNSDFEYDDREFARVLRWYGENVILVATLDPVLKSVTRLGEQLARIANHLQHGTRRGKRFLAALRYLRADIEAWRGCQFIISASAIC